VTAIEQKYEWERAEIVRSRSEADHTPRERLIADEGNIRRYLNPPIDSCYPLEYAYAVLGDVRNRTILDFGCGSGENSLLLARRGARVIGVDISTDLLELAERRLQVNHGGEAQFVTGSAHDLPLKDESVDGVLGIAILHHLDLESSAREIYRVLKPGGLAVFKEPVRDSGLVRFVRGLIPYTAPDVSPFERPLRTSELRGFAKGFTIAAWRAFCLPFVSLVDVTRLNSLTGPAYRLDGALLASAPLLSRFSSTRVLALRKEPAGRA
jgi:SAM-dependent methyltransferase